MSDICTVLIENINLLKKQIDILRPPGSDGNEDELITKLFREVLYYISIYYKGKRYNDRGVRVWLFHMLGNLEETLRDGDDNLLSIDDLRKAER